MTPFRLVNIYHRPRGACCKTESSTAPLW